MFKSATATVRSFSRDEKGNVAMMFGLSIVAISMIAGLAIDYGRASAAKTKVVAAADAAALAAIKGMRLEGLTDDAASQLARRVFDENMSRGGAQWAQINSFTVSIDRNANRAVVDVTSSVPTTLGAISGYSALPASGGATAVFEAKDYEISLQLDLTGSMCDAGPAPCTSHPKIQGLKDATRDLVNIVMPDTLSGQRVRVAYAPFTAGVNLGSYQSAVTGGRTTVSGCVYERKNSAVQATDVAPNGANIFMIASDLQAAPYYAASPRSCPSARVVPLTDDKQHLLDTVDGYVADGFTAGHNGTAWAWNMLAPNFASVWPSESAPADYNDRNTKKIAVLMTDGEYNTRYGKNGDATTISAVAVSTCSAMKAKGIRVYTVGFALGGNATAINTLSACASSAADFFQAATPDELRTAFRSIANDIVTLRLTN